MDHLSKIVVTDIKETLTVSSPKGRFEKINNRKSYGISFCISGQITYTHRGEKFVSDPEPCPSSCRRGKATRFLATNRVSSPSSTLHARIFCVTQLLCCPSGTTGSLYGIMSK